MSRGGLHADQPERRSRRSIRLKGYDYARAGAYFVTICAQNRACLFGEISDRQVVLNDAGQMVETVWNELAIRFPHIQLDEYVVMPNHVHGILVLSRRGEPCVRPDGVRPVSPGDQTSGDNDTQGDHKDRPYVGPESRNVSKSGEQNQSCEHKIPQSGEHKIPQSGEHKVRPYGTLPGTVGRVVQAFKSITTHAYIHGVRQYGWQRFNGKLWQRNYYEHVIRNDDELNRIRGYILENPAQWKLDSENPNAQPNAGVRGDRTVQAD